MNNAVFSELFGENSDGDSIPCYRNVVLNLLPAKLAANFEAKALKGNDTSGTSREKLMALGMELGMCESQSKVLQVVSRILTMISNL